jgi:hypothetical protein
MKLIVTILLSLLLISCTTANSFLQDSVVKENQPIRTLRVVVVYNGNVDVNKALKMIEKASKLTELEVGIRLHVIRCIPVGGESYSMYDNMSIDPSLALSQLYSLMILHGYKLKDYDLALGFANDPFLQKHLSWALHKPFGIIEDDYRKHIVFQHPTVRVIRHEINHAFILSNGHTSLLMGSVSVINPNPNAKWLNKRDRMEVLLNKWRRFDQRVELSSTYRQDRVLALDRTE